MSYRLPLMAIALVATTTAVAAAQDTPRPAGHDAPAAATQAPATASTARPREGAGLNRLLQGITLTAEQRVRVDSIRTRHMSEMPAMTPGTPPDSATRATGRMHMEAMQRDIRAVLTPQQQEAWDKNVAAARAAMQAHRGDQH
jgi:Spy/CpxP family protein refolding chaperone